MESDLAICTPGQGPVSFSGNGPIACTGSGMYLPAASFSWQGNVLLVLPGDIAITQKRTTERVPCKETGHGAFPVQEIPNSF